MKYRNTELLAATDLDVAGTKSIDINVAEPISRIEINWRVTKSVSYMMSYPHKDITKIELVDGSDVLFSMDGGKAAALNIFDRKVPSYVYGSCIGANSQISLYSIDFGRFLHDPLLALDPKKFRNLQLKISHNQSVSDTGATVNAMRVRAELFDEKVISPIGFLMSKAIHEYSLGSENSYEYIDLPVDYPYRKMLIQGYYKSFEPWYSINAARLDEDQDKRVVFDWDMEDYHQRCKSYDQPVEDEFISQVETTARDYYFTPTDYWAHAILRSSSEDQSPACTQYGKGGHVQINMTGSTEVMGQFRGYLPNHCFHFPFGDEMDMDDWYDVTKVGHLRLRLKAGAAATSGSGAVILQQLRRY